MFELAAALWSIITTTETGISEGTGTEGTEASDPEFEGVVFFGDSRVVGASTSGAAGCFVGKVAAGYSWMTGEGAALLDQAVAACPGYDVAFCFGVNDPANVEAYGGWFLDYAASHPETRCWYLSVLPIGDETASSNGYLVTEGMVEAFNERMKEIAGDSYLDVHEGLVLGGYLTPDGVHYDSSTYAGMAELTGVLIREKLRERAAAGE